MKMCTVYPPPNAAMLQPVISAKIFDLENLGYMISIDV